MVLPLLKLVEIHQPKKDAVWKKIKNAGLGKFPVAVDLTKLGGKESAALKAVEELLSLPEARDFPYPLYVVSTITDYQGPLDVFGSLAGLPQFYKQKNRPLNMKENSFLAKVGLKQKNLESVNMDEVGPVFKSFAKSHKVIYRKEVYLDFLNQTLAGLRGKK